MTALKKHIVYVLLASYVALTTAGICLLFGVAKGVESTGSVIGIFATFITQTAAIIVAIVKSKEYFTEPEAVTKLEADYMQSVADLQGQLAKSLKDREDYIAFICTKIMPDDPKHPFYSYLQKWKAEEQQRIDQANQPNKAEQNVAANS